MTTLGRHPDALAVKLTLGDGAHLVASTVNGWAGPVTLHYGPKTGDPVISDLGTVDGDEVSWTLTEAEVTARAEHDWARLEDNGVTIAAGPVMTWLGGSGHTVTQSIASLTAGPPGPTAVSADADNVATLGSDGKIYVPPAAGGFSDAAVAAFVDDTGSSTYASILAGFAATDDPRLSDARTPTAHTHDDRYFTESEVTTALALKSDTGHGHVINDVTGLQAALDGKQAAGSYAAASHTHGVTDLTATGTADSTTFLRGDNTWAVPAGGGGGVTDHGALTGLGDDDHTQYALADGSRGAFAAPLGADDNYVTDAEKAALHSHSNKAALDLVSGTNTGDQVLPTWSTISGKPAVVAAGATQADARTAIGAGTSSFSGDYDDLTDKPTLGDAAAKNTGTTAGTVAAGDHLHDARYVTVVEHGAVAGTARPAGATVVLWIGSVEPTNAVAGDQWDDASGSPSVYIEEPASDGTAGQVLTTDGSGGRTWTTISGGGSVTAGDVDSEAATDGYVLTADGAGGAAWEAASGGGGGDGWTYAVATSDSTTGTDGNPVDATGLSFTALADGLYEIRGMIRGQTFASGTGIQPAIVTPAGCTATVLFHGANNAPAAGSSLTWPPPATTNGTAGPATFTANASASNPHISATIVGTVRASSMSGTMKVTVKSELTGVGSEVTVKADSFIAVRRIAD